MEYDLTSPGQTLVLPPAAVIVDGCAGTVVMVTFRLAGALLPQAFTATTLTVPPVVLVIAVIT